MMNNFKWYHVVPMAFMSVQAWVMGFCKMVKDFFKRQPYPIKIVCVVFGVAMFFLLLSKFGAVLDTVELLEETISGG